VMTVALALLAYRLAGENAGAVLGIALSLRIVAFVLVSPVVGAYAHLLPRRRLLVTLDLARASTVLLLPFVDAVWQIYVLIFAINACSAGFTPVFQATIPEIRGRITHEGRPSPCTATSSSESRCCGSSRADPASAPCLSSSGLARPRGQAQG
jgi:MFS family permease